MKLCIFFVLSKHPHRESVINWLSDFQDFCQVFYLCMLMINDIKIISLKLNVVDKLIFTPDSYPSFQSDLLLQPRTGQILPVCRNFAI